MILLTLFVESIGLSKVETLKSLLDNLNLILMKNANQFVRVDQYDPTLNPGEDYRGKPSMTVPGESYSVQELFDRFSKGLPLTISQAGEYDEEPDFDSVDMGELARMDMVDQEAVLLESKARGIRAKDILDAQASKEAAQTAAYNAKLAKLMEADGLPNATSKLTKLPKQAKRSEA